MPRFEVSKHIPKIDSQCMCELELEVKSGKIRHSLFQNQFQENVCEQRKEGTVS